MKPILFSTPMVQAILDGRKTMTRRVMKDCTQFDIEESQLLENTGYNLTHNYKMSIESVGIFSTKEKLLNWFVAKYSKYQVGDVLWVRETWQNYCLGEPNSGFIYKASPELYHWKKESVIWKPSIFMPKEACRIFLRVTNVRVERLQDITAHDVFQEGCLPLNSCSLKECSEHAFNWWINLWNSINGKGAWEENQFVFVYEFQRIEKPC